MEDRCGDCGIENDGENLNKMPWFVAIKERLAGGGGSHVYHSGALVSGDYVVTAASIFDNQDPIDKTNFEALVGATAFELNIANAYPEGMWMTPMNALLT